MNRTGIEWCDWTWNPVVGCSRASLGCANCYARRMARRLRRNPTLPEHVREAYQRALSPDGEQWADPPQLTFLPERLWQPAKVRHPGGLVFACSMSDLGHELVEPRWRTEVVAAMNAAPWHTFVVLTKRPGLWMIELPLHCWVGVSVESQGAVWRWDKLLASARAGALRFVSVEPMLGPVSFAEFLWALRPDWVIAGPETGPGARRCEARWLESLAAESPRFFDKRAGWERREFPRKPGCAVFTFG